MNLDDLLTESAPPVIARTPELTRELNDLVAACEASESQRRWPVRAVLVGGAMAGVLGIGAVASAAGVLPGWPSFATSSGQTCDVEILASALPPGEGEPISATFNSTEKRATLAEARAFLADFDYDSVDRQQAIDWWRTEESKARTEQSDPSERQPKLVGDDLEVTAVSFWVVNELRADLAVKGLDIRAINVATTSSGCVL
ncbi:hypothetical protein [Nocardioides sp. HB32]